MRKPYLGCAFLAAGHKRFPIKALETFNGVHRPAMAFALFLFGPKWVVQREYLRQCADRPHMIEGYIWNPWRDNIDIKALASGNRREARKLRKRVERFANVIAVYGNSNTHAVATYTLEGKSHGISLKEEKKIAKIVNSVWPYHTCSNGFSSIPKTDYVEFHGAPFRSVADIGSLDGQSINFPHRHARIANDISAPNARKYMRDGIHKNARAVLFWQDLHQDLSDHNRKPIPQRNPRVPKKDRKWMRNTIWELQ